MSVCDDFTVHETIAECFTLCSFGYNNGRCMHVSDDFVVYDTSAEWCRW
jgi:hypothetical protein